MVLIKQPDYAFQVLYFCINNTYIQPNYHTFPYKNVNIIGLVEEEYLVTIYRGLIQKEYLVI